MAAVVPFNSPSNIMVVGQTMSGRELLLILLLKYNY